MLVELRPGVTDASFAAIYHEGYAQGLRYLAAYEDDRCVGVAGWRIVATTVATRKLYVDDLVTRAAGRSRGVGRALVRALRERARDAGCTILDLDSGVQLTCYRIVQESLSNVRTHATGARTSVRVTAGHRALTVEVRNARSETRPRRSEGGGYGLVGMRERASLLGGAFSAQVTEDGGWITRAEIPFDALADAS